jgi:hypothetical protein
MNLPLVTSIAVNLGEVNEPGHGNLDPRPSYESN